MERVKNKITITIQLSELLNSKQSNLLELFKFFNVEDKDKVWGGDYYYYQRNVDVLVSGVVSDEFGPDVEVLSESCKTLDYMIEDIARENDYWF